MSLCLFGNATTGGTDFIAIFLSERKGMDAWNIVLGLNVLILGCSGLPVWLGQGSVFHYLSICFHAVLHTLYKKYQQQTLFIVTDHPRQVCEAISEVSHHGATILHGEGSYELKEHDMVYSVVSSAESKHVINAVRAVDPESIYQFDQDDGVVWKILP